MKISVVIPTWNRAALLVEALGSVRAQTMQPFEVIVVDDGSTDDTRERLARDFPEVRCLHQENRGVSSARNTGIQAATGDWIALLDSDDCWLPGKLERQVRALQENPWADLCHCDERWIRNGVRVNPMNKHAKRGGRIFRDCLPLCIISPSAVLIRRERLLSAGLFDESLPACEDYDLWLRLCAEHPVLFVDEALLVKYGGHADQLSRRHWGMDRFRIRALEKILAGNQLQADDHAAALAMLEKKLRIVVGGAEKRNNTRLLETYRKKQRDWLGSASGQTAAGTP